MARILIARGVAILLIASIHTIYPGLLVDLPVSELSLIVEGMPSTIEGVELPQFLHLLLQLSSQGALLVNSIYKQSVEGVCGTPCTYNKL